MVLVDGLHGQMMESVHLNRPVNKRFLPPKDWATTGTRNHPGRNIVNSLNIDPVKLEQHNLKLQKKYQNVINNETKYELVGFENDPEYVIVAYGTMSRIVRSAIESMKEQGIRVGLLRPISLWPFPKEAFAKIPVSVKGILTCEMSLGQMLDDVRIANNGRFPVGFFGRTGGMIPEPEEIENAIRHFSETVVK
jgi:2-oxoglutarate ferredoxin oxidoreductase subunit alpha